MRIRPPIALVGEGIMVETLVAGRRRYISLDMAASTSAFTSVAKSVNDFLPFYSSVHRGAGYKSQVSTDAYEKAREAVLAFAGRDGRDDVAIFVRHATDAINHLAYRLRLTPQDIVVTTVVEHHANLLPWMRYAQCRHVECGTSGTFELDDVVAALDRNEGARLLAITGASNVTGWLPPIDDIIEAAHERGVPVFVDAAQLAPHRPMPVTADYVAFSAHKMYAPFGTGVLVGPRATFDEGDPLIHGGGAIDLVDLDHVVWTSPPDREEAGSPNVVGAVALHAAIDELKSVGWEALEAHEHDLSQRLREGLASIPGVRLLGPGLEIPTLAVAAFDVEGLHYSLVAARLSHEFGIGVRHGCFCAHPYVTRLLGLKPDDLEKFRADISIGDRRDLPGAVRASAGISSSVEDVDALIEAVAVVTGDEAAPTDYRQDPATGDFAPLG